MRNAELDREIEELILRTEVRIPISHDLCRSRWQWDRH
jgi:hypothetical protein